MKTVSLSLSLALAATVSSFTNAHEAAERPCSVTVKSEYSHALRLGTIQASLNLAYTNNTDAPVKFVTVSALNPNGTIWKTGDYIGTAVPLEVCYNNCEPAPIKIGSSSALTESASMGLQVLHTFHLGLDELDVGVALDIVAKELKR